MVIHIFVTQIIILLGNLCNYKCLAKLFNYWCIPHTSLPQPFPTPIYMLHPVKVDTRQEISLSRIVVKYGCVGLRGGEVKDHTDAMSPFCLLMRHHAQVSAPGSAMKKW